MNRFELLVLALILFAGFVVLLKSKWFDRSIDSLLRGTKSTTVNDLAQDKTRFNEAKENLKKNLDKQAAQVKTDRKNLSSL